MKPIFSRRARRSGKAAPEGAFFKKETQHESQFFSGTASDAFFNATTAAIQRKCDSCAEEEKKDVSTADLKKDVEKKVVEEKKEEEMKVQKKDTAGAAHATPPHVPSLAGKGTAMSPQVNHFFASRMGADFSNVRIHTDAEAAQSARSLNAQAYTIGTNVVFAEGRYLPETTDGKTLLAHELTHVLQQSGERLLQRKEDEPETCGNTLDIAGYTDATFKKGKGTEVGKKRTKSDDCEACPDDCVTITGSLSVPYTVKTRVDLPAVPEHLTPCQKKRVAAGIKNVIAPHEQQHVKAFKTYEGKPRLPIDYKGCEAGYNSYLEDLAETEHQRRETAAKEASEKLDPFSYDVDLCCTEPAAKGKK